MSSNEEIKNYCVEGFTAASTHQPGPRPAKNPRGRRPRTRACSLPGSDLPGSKGAGKDTSFRTPFYYAQKCGLILALRTHVVRHARVHQPLCTNQSIGTAEGALIPRYTTLPCSFQYPSALRSARLLVAHLRREQVVVVGAVGACMHGAGAWMGPAERAGARCAAEPPAVARTVGGCVRRPTAAKSADERAPHAGLARTGPPLPNPS